MAARTVEREVKFDVGPEFALPDLNGVVDDARQTELPRAELAATYFDTPDRRLLARGITLRHRRDRADPSDQGQWTLKLPARLGGLALERTELTWPGELSTVPDEALRLLRADRSSRRTRGDRRVGHIASQARDRGSGRTALGRNRRRHRRRRPARAGRPVPRNRGRTRSRGRWLARVGHRPAGRGRG